MGATRTQEEDPDAPEELLFIHGGHKAAVNDVTWNPNVGGKCWFDG